MGSFLFFAFSWWGIVVRVVAIVHFIRRRPDFFWIWVILIHPIGALVYIALPPARDFATSGLESGLVLAYLFAVDFLKIRIFRRFDLH